MAIYRYRIPPCSEYNVPAMERWLEDMAAKGLHLSTDGFFGLAATFEEGPPKRERFRLEPTTTKGGILSNEYAPDEKTQALCAQMGWTYRARRGQFHIWSCDDPHAPELHTDPQIQAMSVAALGKHLRKRLFGNLFIAALYLFVLYGDIILTAAIGYGSWWVVTALGLFTWGLVHQFLVILWLARWRKALQNGEPLPQRQTRPGLYFIGRAVETVSFAAVLVNLVFGSMNIMAETDMRQMEQNDTFPFATAADFYPGSTADRMQGILESEYTVWSDFIAPVNYDLNEYAKITQDGKSFDVYLSVNYHELRWEWAAERLARELVSQSGANAVDQTFEKLTNGDPIYATELNVEGADSCVYFYRYRGSPTIVLRSGTTVVRANLDVLGEERTMDVQEIAEILLLHIS